MKSLNPSSCLRIMNFNRAIIVGNVTRDPETRSLPSGQNVAHFGVATNRYWTNQQNGEKQEAAEFHNIVAFGRLAEICSQYLNKGSLVLIEGRLQTGSWQGQDGIKRYRTEIIAQNIQLGPRSQGAAAPSSAPRPTTKPATNQEQAILEEDIPVIDADEEPNQNNQNQKTNSDSPASTAEEGEVNVDNIPF